MVAGAGLATAIVLGPGLPAFAATTNHPVRENTLRDGAALSPSASDTLWYREDTRPGGGATLTKNFNAPPGFGDGALALSTNSLNSAKAQMMTSDTVRGAALADVGDLSYWTYQSSLTSGSAEAGPSFQLRVDIDGDLSTTADVTNLVYEPYWNDTEGASPQGALTPDTWQYWDMTNGQWWSSKQISCGAFSVLPGAGGPPFTTPGAVATNCVGSKVVEIGVNVGSFNPNYLVAVDGVKVQLAGDDHIWNFGPLSTNFGPK
jgi:hypothetical protein